MLTLNKLTEIGCSTDFAKKALQYRPMYNGDIEKFVLSVEQMLRVRRDADRNHIEPSSPAPVGSSISEGVRRSEHDYTGDSLTYHGYDLVNDNSERH